MTPPHPPLPPSTLWQLHDTVLDLSGHTHILGIVNVTPDSFSDGGRCLDPRAAVDHGLRLLDEGADLLDIGGESTRPGAEPVAAEEELRRILPVLRGLAAARPGARLTVDTSKATVARAALEAGAQAINDVTAGADPDMFGVAAEAGAGLVLMHMQGLPRTMQLDPHYTDVVAEVAAHLQARMQAAIAAGVPPACIVLDPGIGFGKTLQHNLALLAGLPSLTSLGRPLLVGVSRKRCLGEITGRNTGDRLAASLGALAACIQAGARIIRVHDAKESCDVARVLDTIHRAGPPHRPPPP